MKVELTFIADSEIGRIYEAEYQGITFLIVAAPGHGADGSWWELEVETQSRSVESVRELDPAYHPREGELYPSLDTALYAAQQQIREIADAYQHTARAE